MGLLKPIYRHYLILKRGLEPLVNEHNICLLEIDLGLVSF